MNTEKLSHTPGPFILRKHGDVITVEKITGDIRSVIASASDAGLCPEHGGTVMGNMLMAAAAPDLLAACKSSIEIFELALERAVTVTERTVITSRLASACQAIAQAGKGSL